ERFCYVYDVSKAGNFEGRNILNLPKTIEQCATLKRWDIEPLREELAESRRKLLAIRDRRVRPGKDDKILVSWNSLMIDSLARAASVLNEPRYQEAAARAARFLLDQLRRPDGRMLHCWRAGRARFDAYLDDYAFLINALVSLYQTDFDEAWIESAVQLADTMLRHFADPAGGFYFTADDHEPLIVRTKEVLESSVPSGNAMAATSLWRLGRLCGNTNFLAAADAVVQSSADLMLRAPTAMGQMLIAADMQVGPMREIVVLGDPRQGDTAQVLADLRRRYQPNHLVACRTPDRADDGGAMESAFRGKTMLAAEPTVYICENFACQAPVSGVEAALQAWDELTGQQFPERELLLGEAVAGASISRY
nr:thioredoxin domain-containing protein [Pirellulaceae bacterium]